VAAGSGGGGDTGSLGNTPNTEGDGSANSSTSNGPTGKTNDAAGNGEWDRSILYGTWLTSTAPAWISSVIAAGFVGTMVFAL